MWSQSKKEFQWVCNSTWMSGSKDATRITFWCFFKWEHKTDCVCVWERERERFNHFIGNKALYILCRMQSCAQSILVIRSMVRWAVYSHHLFFYFLFFLNNVPFHALSIIINLTSLFVSLFRFLSLSLSLNRREMWDHYGGEWWAPKD